MQGNTQTITKRLRVMVMSVVLVVLVMQLIPQGIAYADPRPDTGSLTIHKYYLEEMDDTGVPNDGNPTTDIPLDAVPLGGITFSIWQVNPSSAGSVTGAADAWPYIMTSTLQTGETDIHGELTFQNLDAGLYYVAETGSVSGSSVVLTEPFLVSVPMKNATTDEWITNVHAYPKNQILSIDKFVGAAGGADYDFVNAAAAKSRPVSVGELFGWSTFASLPANLSTANPESYTLTDDIGLYSEYVAGTVEVYSVPTMTTPVGLAYHLTEGLHYTSHYVAATRSVKVSLTDAGMALLGERYTDEQDRFLLLKYDCKLIGSAPNGVRLFSTAEVEYARNRAGTRVSASVGGGSTSFADYTMDSTESSLRQAAVGDGNATLATAVVLMLPSVNTGQIEVTKYKEDTKEILAGAEFGIAKTEADALTGNFIATGTTNASGKLTFTGLGYGLPGDGPVENSNNTTFWLMETKAPEGYKLMESPVEVFFNLQAAENGEYYFARVSVYDAAKGTSGLTSLFPKTGDTIGFIIIGIVALAAAGGILVYAASRRRRQ